jgi:YfiH family protein
MSTDWIVPDWPAPAGVKSLITTRNGGVSTGAFASLNLGSRSGDEVAAVAANRERLRRSIPQEPKWLRQIHGTKAVVADGPIDSTEADASVARQRGTVCAVLVADCLPVLLCDSDATVVAIAHAGWRGLSGGVIENTVRATGVAPNRLLAYLGPAIGPAAYEVGTDVREAFVRRNAAAASAFTANGRDKWMADLFTLARQRLASTGVSRVFGGSLCTASDPARFFSYRRDGVTGRMAALIWLA